MAEYIEREAVLSCFAPYSDSWVAVKCMDAADVMPVVYCKNCKYYHLFEEGFRDCRHSGGLDDASPDDFCSYGEAKMDVDDES